MGEGRGVENKHYYISQHYGITSNLKDNLHISHDCSAVCEWSVLATRRTGETARGGNMSTEYTVFIGQKYYIITW